jgi:hypothetical protein
MTIAITKEPATAQATAPGVPEATKTAKSPEGRNKPEATRTAVAEDGSSRTAQCFLHAITSTLSDWI